MKQLSPIDIYTDYFMMSFLTKWLVFIRAECLVWIESVISFIFQTDQPALDYIRAYLSPDALGSWIFAVIMKPAGLSSSVASEVQFKPSEAACEHTAHLRNSMVTMSQREVNPQNDIVIPACWCVFGCSKYCVNVCDIMLVDDFGLYWPTRRSLICLSAL